MPHRAETADQAATFAYYYSMGDGRSLRKLRQSWGNVGSDRKSTPALSTLENWSSWFNWQQRIIIKDKAVADGIDFRTTKSIVDRKAELLELVDSLIDSCFERDKNGKPVLKLQIEKPRDFKEAVELALKLMGEPERSELALDFEWLDDDDDAVEDKDDKDDKNHQGVSQG
jgi:hypothetical protein